MRRRQSALWGLFTAVVLLAAVLQVMPMYGDLAIWRPHFVLMALTYFLLYRPQYYGIATAWCAGILLDVLYGDLFGKYALSLGLCAYLFPLLRHRLLHAMTWHQCGFVFVLVAAAQLIVLSVDLLASHEASWRLIWCPALSSALLWPPVVLLLKRLSRQHKRTKAHARGR